MILCGYADELHRESELRLSYEEGFKKGQLIASIMKIVKICRKINMPENEILTTIMEEFSLDEKEVRECIAKGEKYISEMLNEGK